MDGADALRDSDEASLQRYLIRALGISLFRDNYRTRFSFASACNLLGLEVQDVMRVSHVTVRDSSVRQPDLFHG